MGMALRTIHYFRFTTTCPANSRGEDPKRRQDSRFASIVWSNKDVEVAQVECKSIECLKSRKIHLDEVMKLAHNVGAIFLFRFAQTEKTLWRALLCRRAASVAGGVAALDIVDHHLLEVA